MSRKRSRPFRMPPLSWARATWKHKLIIAAVWVMCSVLGAVGIYFIPARYKATALILVQSQRIPQTFVASTVAEDLNERLSNLKQQILSYSRLLEVVKKYNLYAEESKTHFEEEVIDRMRGDIEITLEKGWTSDRPGAFRVSYKGPSAAVVAMVANELGDLFIDENLRAREVQASGTSEFLDNQLNEAKTRLQQQEAKLGEYKIKYNGELPEQQTALLRRVDQLQSQLQSLQEASSRAQQNETLVATSLKLAQDSYASMTELVQRPPDDGQMTAAGRPAPRLSKQLQDQLRSLRMQYTNNHPDVIRTQKLLDAALKAEAQEEQENIVPQAGPAGAGVIANRPKSRSLPVVQILERERERVAQLKSQELVLGKQIADLDRDRGIIMRELAATQARIDKLPLREQEMASVTRDYQISKANYQSLLDKKLAADMAADMERRQKAERFTMLDRARVPEKPFQPNRPLLTGAACFIALLLGGGIALARELHANVLLGEWEIPSGVVVLARIPIIGPLRPALNEAPQDY